MIWVELESYCRKPMNEPKNSIIVMGVIHKLPSTGKEKLQ
jgi:hypothetical protein